MAIKINNVTVIDDSRNFIVSANTTENRPGSPTTGTLRFNTTTTSFEGYTGATWTKVGEVDELARTLATLAL